jgi:hypothetical protein
VKSKPDPPMTLGGVAAAGLRLIVWCKDCQHQVEPDPAEMAQRYGAETTVPDWRERLICSRCGSQQVDMVARVKCAASRYCCRAPSTPVTREWGEGKFCADWLVRESLYGLPRAIGWLHCHFISLS